MLTFVSDSVQHSGIILSTCNLTVAFHVRPENISEVFSSDLHG